ncbi:MAG: tetratricopeptide repeat protein [Desulfobacteraceae bacterium]|nr:MAG: tetratricopeptide repeat protein [Desulfobacteraceae bacterium]
MDNIWRTSFVLLFAGVLGGLLLQGCVSDQPGRTGLMQPVNEKDHDAAVRYYTQALQEDPESPDLKLGLSRSRQSASVYHMQMAERLMANRYYIEAIDELRVSVAFYPGNTRALELLETAKRLKESAYYSQKGAQQIRMGEYKHARQSYQRALELNPENTNAQHALEYFKPDPEDLAVHRLDFRSDEPVSLKFKKTPVVNVFEIISKLSGINFIFDKDVKDSKVTLFMADVSMDQFLEVLLTTSGLKGKQINRKTMLIYPDTGGKAKIYDELYVRTFYLSYLESKGAVALLTKMLGNKNITANNSLNSVTVRGARDELEVAARIIEANDRTPAEVVLNVEILEVSRNKEKDLGLSISDTITFGISESSSGISTSSPSGFAPLASIRDLGHLTSKELYLSLPTATLKLLKQDGDTKILAKPQIRVTNQGKASIHIGERVPIRTNRKVLTDGSTTYDFQYQDVGIKLTAEPEINLFNRVTMKLNIEVSALGSNVGTPDDPQYAIKTRHVNTVMTVDDGGNVIIGGLIQDEDRSSTQKIPLAGDIPVLGRLFTSVNSASEEKDILMSITPVIIRHPDMPQKEVSQFWSGTQSGFSLRMPEAERARKETNYIDLPDKAYIKAISKADFLPDDTFFSLHVFTTTSIAEAENRAREIEKLGYDTWVRKEKTADEGSVFSVYAGQYSSYHQAEEARIDILGADDTLDNIRIVDRDDVYK